MQNKSTSTTNFRFLELPREIRDLIYDDGLEDREDQELSCGLLLRAKSVPQTNILLVSKQVKREYEDQARQNRRLIIKDILRDGDVIAAPAEVGSHYCLPGPASKVSKIVLEPYVEQLRELLIHLERLTPLIGMVTSPSFNTRSLTVRIVTSIENDDEFNEMYDILPETVNDWISTIQEQGWHTLPKLQSLQLLDAGDDYYEASRGREVATKLIAEFKKGGELEVLEEPKEKLLDSVVMACYVERNKWQDD